MAASTVPSREGRAWRPRRRRGRPRLDYQRTSVRKSLPAPLISIYVLLTRRSDPHNPELAVKQILAIAPILPGQKVSREFEIPPRSAGKEKAAGGSDNLIDFADENSAPGPGGLSQGQNATSQGGLIDTQDHGASNSGSGLMEPLQPSQSQQPGHPLRRLDTNTKEVDEFVDAKEK